MAIFDNRICRTCGIKFSGGPRAWYCPTCRAERTKERQRKQKQNGAQRHIGDTDYCTRCGKKYKVESGNQKFCESCREDIKKLNQKYYLTKNYQKNREKRTVKQRKYYEQNKDVLKEKRDNAPPEKKLEQKKKSAEWYQKHKAELSDYYKKRYQKKKQKQNSPKQD